MRIRTIALLAAAVLGAAVLGGCQTTHSINKYPGDLFTDEDDACLQRAPGETLAGYQVPIYECYEEPIYRTQRTPVYGYETVPVYRTRRKPVTWPTKDYCTGCESEKTLWCVDQKVQVGVKRVHTCIGYKSERICVGTCKKRRICGWRTVEPPPCPCPPDPCAK